MRLTQVQLDEGIVTLVDGWVLTSANAPFIDSRTLPISSISSFSLLSIPLSEHLDVFRCGVFVLSRQTDINSCLIVLADVLLL
jgi:hypothetical protein